MDALVDLTNFPSSNEAENGTIVISVENCSKRVFGAYTCTKPIFDSESGRLRRKLRKSPYLEIMLGYLVSTFLVSADHQNEYKYSGSVGSK